MGHRKINVRTANIGPTPDKSGLRFRLALGAPNLHESIEFDIGIVESERFAKSILRLLPSGSDPSRSTRVQAGGNGKPKLRIVR
jgi:hypothetical protein